MVVQFVIIFGNARQLPAPVQLQQELPPTNSCALVSKGPGPMRRNEPADSLHLLMKWRCAFFRRAYII